MADTIQTVKPPVFTTVKYTTKDGENVTATKKDGIVTLNGDKNGTRQMPLDDFVKKELCNNVKEMKVENSQVAQNSQQPVQAQNEPVSNPIQKTETPVLGKKLDVIA